MLGASLDATGGQFIVKYWRRRRKSQTKTDVSNLIKEECASEIHMELWMAQYTGTELIVCLRFKEMAIRWSLPPFF